MESQLATISDYPYRILIMGGSVLGKTNALLIQINQKLYPVKIPLYAKDQYEEEHPFLTHKRKCAGLKHFNGCKAFINTQMTCTIFMKTLKIQSKVKNTKYC